MNSGIKSQVHITTKDLYFGTIDIMNRTVIYVVIVY